MIRMSSLPTVLVYEFFSGGGFPGRIPAGLAAEALGMRWALLVDFRRWGAVRTITALDPRFEERVAGLNRKTLPADEVLCTAPADAQQAYLYLLKRCDAALILAPETNGTLADLLRQAELAGIPLLCSTSSAVSIAGDKAACNRLFRTAKLPSPRARTASFTSARRLANQIGFPLVMKPLDGVASEGVCFVDSDSDLPRSLVLVRRITAHDRILLQSYVSGVHASVSMLISSGRSLPLSLNRQLIEPGLPFQYHGSQVPFDHREGSHAVELARLAVGLIPGLQGYVGVDLVLQGGTAQLIEINPRLTTSYIGLRQISRINLAKAMWEACLNEVLPRHVPLAGQVVIKKDDPETWGLNSSDRLHNSRILA
jgi:predicted ATP-grasp superfamily ATP-dependent carboligase